MFQMHFLTQTKFMEAILNLESKVIEYKPNEPIIKYKGPFYRLDELIYGIEKCIEITFPKSYNQKPKPKIIKAKLDFYTEA